MIQSDRKNGRELARCVCDVCGAETSIPAMHGTAPPGSRGLKQVKLPPLANEASVVKRLQADRWSLISNKLRCPSCEATRKSPKEPAMDNISEIRQPTREQIREIVQALEIMYDTKAGRYTGGQTDATVANDMGGGIMPGWVAIERERAFGPAGGNEELDALQADAQEYWARIKALEATIAAEVRGLEAFGKRLGAIKAAVGPKAAHV